MSNKILKISFASAPIRADISQYLDVLNPLVSKWDIRFNDPETKTADVWCIIEDLPVYDSTCLVAPNKILYFSAETAQNLEHIEENQNMRKFLGQFSKVFSFHQFIDSSLISSAPYLPWMIHSNHGTSIWDASQPKLQEIEAAQTVQKSKLISVICSAQDMTPAHRMRIRFVTELQKQFGPELDWFGNGIQGVDNKWDAIAPYKYHVVLENQSRYNVITEKIGDAFLGLTYPFYWGAPNVNSYFDSKGFSQIYIEDFRGSLQTIRDGISSNLYENAIDVLKKNRTKTLHEFNFINRILIEAENVLSFENSISVHLNSPADFDSVIVRSYAGFQKTFLKAIDEIDKVLGTNFKSLSKEIYILLRYNKVSKHLSRLL